MEGPTNVLNVWTRNPKTNLSYKVIPYDCQQTPFTYEDICKKESGHLASIHSQQEDSFISGSFSTVSLFIHLLGNSFSFLFTTLTKDFEMFKDLKSVSKNLISSTGLGIRSCHCKHIGLYSTATHPDVFHWLDGTTVNYLNWKINEPHGIGPHCAFIWQMNGWISGECTDTSSGCCAVCQKYDK
ncbi:hypothetical protein X798_04064 [Onchocerca flexuosa]|uniref:C-type lectin domain-containing protein n=1 Tax=Onchocerca flexuosa TaxID=387005 RepID=A0A238BUG6_9BILA|nr:hypothetical protein X798_04064 [Onchocerca flexuosa]